MPYLQNHYSPQLQIQSLDLQVSQIHSYFRPSENAQIRYAWYLLLVVAFV